MPKQIFAVAEYGKRRKIMGDTISRKAAIKRFKPWLKIKDYSEGEINIVKAVLDELKDIQSPKAEKGEWIQRECGAMTCSLCGSCSPIVIDPYRETYYHIPSKYCPGCGKPMKRTPRKERGE
jgi:hypothetical protein